LRHNVLCLRNQSLTLFTLPHPLYTVDRSESAVVLIRIWLCSAFRVRQPNRPDSGIPASPAVNRRILASFPPPCKAVSVGPRLLPGQRYPIEIRKLTQRHPNHRTSLPSGRRILPKRPQRCVSQCRANTATNRKRVAYKLVNDNSTHPDKMRHPRGVFRRSGEAGPRFLQVVKAP
jgi:hypothetical protein